MASSWIHGRSPADRAPRDPRDPTRVAPRFATGDGVHTNDLGNRVWARAVPLGLL